VGPTCDIQELVHDWLACCLAISSLTDPILADVEYFPFDEQACFRCEGEIVSLEAA